LLKLIINRLLIAHWYASGKLPFPGHTICPPPNCDNNTFVSSLKQLDIVAFNDISANQGLRIVFEFIFTNLKAFTLSTLSATEQPMLFQQKQMLL